MLNRYLLGLFLIALFSSDSAAGEEEVILESHGKGALEAPDNPDQLDPLLVDEVSPRLRRLGAALERHTVPRPWVLVPDTYEVRDREYYLYILGYIKLDVMHDFNRLGQSAGFPNYFIPSEIPVQGAYAAQGSGRTGVTINSSRFEFGLGTDTPIGEVGALLDFNFLRKNTGGPALNIRQFYLELDQFRGGKSWTTFLNLDSIPDTLDYQGPNSLPELRQPLLRWTQPLAVGPASHSRLLENSRFVFAIEWAGGDLSLPPGVKVRNPVPDFIASVQYNKNQSSVWLSGIYRRLAAKGNGVDSETNGWGIQLAGNIPIKDVASLQFGAIYGAGLASYINDTEGLSLDGAIDSNGKLQAFPTATAWLGAQYWWMMDLRSTVSYGYVYLSDNFLDPVASDTEGIYKQGHYASANLIWSPIPPVDVGIEYLFGYRENNDGRNGFDNRLQFSIILHFASGKSARGSENIWERLVDGVPKQSRSVFR